MKKKITNYKQLNDVIIDVVKKEERPLSASEIEAKILNEYKISRIRTSPKTISSRMRGKKNIRVIKRARENHYEFIGRELVSL